MGRESKKEGEVERKEGVREERRKKQRIQV